MKYSDDELKKKLKPMEYKIAVEGATEMPFTGEYLNNDKKGIYVDIISAKPLFSSLDKFDSGCGWPAFSKPIDRDAVVTKDDDSFGRTRTEVRNSQADTHLGHVFDDGPEELGGLRYCINSAVLRFVAYEDMEKEGYGEYMYIFENSEGERQ